MNVVDPILFQCRYQQPVAAMCAPGAALPLISYGRLERFVHNIARSAQAHGLERGHVVALLIDEPILHAAFILGLTRLGIATVSVHSPDLPKELQVDAVIADKPYLSRTASRIILADMSWTEGDGRPVLEASSKRSGADMCRISLTSGSTGEPKAVGFSHDLLIRRIARYGWAYGEKAANCSRMYIDPGLGTQIGFLLWLYTLSKGGTVFFRGDDAIETMQTFSLYNVQCMVASPAALAEFVTIYESAPAFPPSFEAIVTAGSLLAGSLSERIRSRLCSHLVCAYGATETHSVATAPAYAIVDISGAVGFVTPDMSVEIVDHAGNVLPLGQEGLVRVRSEVAADGYLGDPAETRRAFRDGWFYPGDLGTLTADHVLIISGREKSVLNLGGNKVNPERIEQVLLSYPGIKQAAAFGILNPMGIEELWIAVVSESFNENALRSHCERHLPTGLEPLHFLSVNRIPMTETGKIDRRGLVEVVKNS